MKGPPTHWTTLKKLIYLKAARGFSPSWVWQLLTGTAPLTLLDAVAHPLHSLTQYGKCVQDGTPTPTAPADVVCNNGALKVRRQSGLPVGYQMVEWLKSTGAVVITGFKTKSTQEITTVFYRERSGAAYLYSSDTATSGTTNTTAYITSGSGNWRWDGKATSISVPIGNKITSIQKNDGVWLNGTKSGSYSDAGDFVSANDLRLSSSENTTIRFYSQTVREGEIVTLDLVAVQRLSDSAYGFYDKVSGEFYTNDEATFTAGDPIDDPVEIYTDGADEVLMVSGANLLDPSTSNITIGEQVNAQGQSATATNNWRTDYIPVVGGKTYIFYGRMKSDDVISAYSRMNFYKSDKTAITPRPSYTQDTPSVATAPPNAAYVRLSCAPINSQNTITRETFDAFNWMFAEAAQEIPFEPYHAPQTVNDVPMLLGLGDAYRDALEFVSGLLTHKIGIKVFDGTETFTVSSSGAMITTIPDVAIGAENNPMNTRFALEPSATSIAVGTQRFGEIGTKILSTNYYMKHPTITTVPEFKTWLASLFAAGTPDILVYPLAEETTEQTTPHSLHTTQGTNVVDVSAAVEDVTASVEYAKQNA